MKSRAIRRHHTERIKERARKKARQWNIDEQFCVQRANNMAHCSCFMCKNPRRRKWSRKNQLTLQERRITDFEKCVDYINDIDYHEYYHEYIGIGMTDVEYCKSLIIWLENYCDGSKEYIQKYVAVLNRHIENMKRHGIE